MNELRSSSLTSAVEEFRRDGVSVVEDRVHLDDVVALGCSSVRVPSKPMKSAEAAPVKSRRGRAGPSMRFVVMSETSPKESLNELVSPAHPRRRRVAQPTQSEECEGARSRETDVRTEFDFGASAAVVADLAFEAEEIAITPDELSKHHRVAASTVGAATEFRGDLFVRGVAVEPTGARGNRAAETSAEARVEIRTVGRSLCANAVPDGHVAVVAGISEPGNVE